MKKVFIITHQLSRTGAPLVLLDMIKQYKKEGCELSVISYLEGELRSEIEDLGISVRIQDSFLKDWESFLKEVNSFDLVVCNTLVSFEPIHLLKMTNVPTLWWIHEGEQFFDHFKTVLPDFTTLPANIMLRAVSPYVSDIFMRRFGMSVDILPFGMPDYCLSSDGNSLSESLVKVLSEINPDNDKVGFICAGAYSKIKGQDILCEAIRSLGEEDLERSFFLFCGSEDTVDEAVLQDVIRLEKDHPSSVLRCGNLSHEDLLKLMSAVDFALVPSRVETMSAITIEAMCLKKPTILSTACGVSRYLTNEENALIASDYTYASFGNILHKAVNMSKERRKALGEAARIVYENNFTEEIFQKNILKYI